MKKILYIITQSEWGGAQRYVFDLATNLSKSQQYQIYIAAGPARNASCSDAGEGNGQLFDRLEAPAHNATHSVAGGQKLTTVRLKHLIRAIHPFHDLMAYFELKKLLDNIKPDIVHLNSSKAGILGSLAAKKVGIPKIIYTAHGFVFNEPLPFWKKWLYKKIELFSSRRIDKIIAVSDFDRQTGIAAGIDANKLITIHNGINQDEFNFLPRDEARQQLPKIINHSSAQGGLQFSTPVIGCIANFYPTKGLDILIQAMTKIDATLILIGEGAERKNLENLISKLNLKNKVFLAGLIDNASQYLKVFDLFVLPSRKEGLSYTLLEAAAAGVPIVATRVGGTPEIIQDDFNGYLAPPNNPNDLAAAIKKSLAQPLEPKLSGFDLAAMVEQTEKIYEF